MRSFVILLLVCIGAMLGLVTCVDPVESTIISSLSVIVVDGGITNVDEPQVVRLSRSHPDPLTGRFGQFSIRGARVSIVVDSVQVIALTETESGRYQAPDGFKGQVGHAYQLRFTLSDEMHYESTTETMQPVPSVAKVSSQFNPKSLSPAQLTSGYQAAHDLFVDFRDPTDQRNFYRWDWILWERQEWCRSCVQGIYQINDDKGNLVEGCVPYRGYTNFFTFDYNCRTQCWEILYNSDINILADTYSNGNIISHYRAAQIPYYQHHPCLVEIRQSSLTLTAYTYFNQLLTQTQHTGGVADTPPSVPIGNVRNIINPGEAVVGYFTASSVSSVRYWLDRKDTTVLPLGATDPNGPSPLTGAELLYALYQREPNPEVGVQPSRYRPPLAVCVPSDNRTPYRPEGWRD